MRGWQVTAGVAAIALSSMGCVVLKEPSHYDPADNPGNHAWNTDETVSCASDADCTSGEICQDGVCQMRRCADSYSSNAPMGVNRYFGTDGELAIISDDSFIDGFEADGSGTYLDSWDLQASGNKVIDITGGNLTGKRPHQLAVALEFTDSLTIRDGKTAFHLPLGMWPKAIASGDVDADGLDEVVAFGEDGTIKICDVDKKTCASAKFEGVKGRDVAVADVDGDGYAEPVFLTDDSEDTSGITVWNLDYKSTGQEPTLAWSVSFRVRAMAAGDVRGTGSAEIALLEDRGWFGFASDRIHMFSPTSAKLVSSSDVNGLTIDIAIGDRNSDAAAEIAFLRQDHKYQLMSATDGGLQSIGVYDIVVGNTAQRLSIVDWNGDSASARLTEGPELVPGNAVPIAALMFPPFAGNFADGPAAIDVGSSDSQSAGNSHSIKLEVGLAVSFGAEAPLFEARVGAHLNKEWSATHSVTKSQTIAQSFSIESQPALYGSDYGAVILSCGCYHRYHYVTEDPANRIGGSGKGVDIYVPIGGQTQLWSTKRYNAMAKAAGTLPEIHVPVRVGELDSYSKELRTLEGQVIPKVDMLFPKPPTFQVSDVGVVGFALVTGQSETNETAESTTIGVSGSIEAFGVGVESSIDVGVEQGYSIEVGSEAEFGGSVPAMPDDPTTPEDEYTNHHYGFTPFVYRQHYRAKNGSDAAYYVLHYAIAK